MTMLTVALFLQLPPGGAQPNSIWNLRIGSILDRGVIAKWSLATKAEQALKALKQGDVTLGRFVVYPSALDYAHSKAQGGTDCTHESWETELAHRRAERTQGKCPDLYHALKLGSQIIIRSLKSDCSVHRVIVPLDNFARSRLQTVVLNAQLVDLVARPAGGRDAQASVTLFFQTNKEVSVQTARELLEQARDLEKDVNLTVVLRNDTWFASHCQAPLFPAVALTSIPPDDDAFARSKESVCVSLKGWPVRCY